jgi:hypothetical protein
MFLDTVAKAVGIPAFVSWMRSAFGWEHNADVSSASSGSSSLASYVPGPSYNAAYVPSNAPLAPLPAGWERWGGARPEPGGGPQNTILHVPGLTALTQDARAALIDVSTQLGVPVDSLALVIQSESGWNPTALNPLPAAGFIQLTTGANLPGFKTADAVRAITAMDPVTQIESVALPFYKRFGAKAQGANPGQLYILNFLPAVAGSPDTTVLGVRPDNFQNKGLPAGSGPNGESPSDPLTPTVKLTLGTIYGQNWGFDGGQKGYFTVGDIYKRLEKLAAATKGERIAVDGTIIPAPYSSTFTAAGCGQNWASFAKYAAGAAGVLTPLHDPQQYALDQHGSPINTDNAGVVWEERDAESWAPFLANYGAAWPYSGQKTSGGVVTGSAAIEGVPRGDPRSGIVAGLGDFAGATMFGSLPMEEPVALYATYTPVVGLPDAEEQAASPVLGGAVAWAGYDPYPIDPEDGNDTAWAFVPRTAWPFMDEYIISANAFRAEHLVQGSGQDQSPGDTSGYRELCYEPDVPLAYQQDVTCPPGTDPGDYAGYSAQHDAQGVSGEGLGETVDPALYAAGHRSAGATSMSDITALVRQGIVPAAQQGLLDPIAWTQLTVGPYQIMVTNEPLAVNGIRLPVSMEDAVALSNLLGVLPITPIVSDARWNNPGVQRVLAKPLNDPQGAIINDPGQVARYNAAIGPNTGVLTDGYQKELVVVPGLQPKGRGSMAQYGFRKADGTMFEHGGPSNHDLHYKDYSDTPTFMSRKATQDGVGAVDLLDVLSAGDPAIGGPLPSWLTAQFKTSAGGVS